MAIVDHNKGFKIPIFCIPYSDFEVDEDRLGSRYTPRSICLFVYTWMTRSIDASNNGSKLISLAYSTSRSETKIQNSGLRPESHCFKTWLSKNQVALDLSECNFNHMQYI